MVVSDSPNCLHVTQFIDDVTVHSYFQIKFPSLLFVDFRIDQSDISSIFLHNAL